VSAFLAPSRRAPGSAFPTTSDAVHPFRSGEQDAFAVDETIHRYHRARASSGSSAGWAASAPERIARVLEAMAAEGEQEEAA
jgi:hypothetical protein